MRILYLYPHPYHGPHCANDRQTLQTLQAITRAGYDVDLLTLPSPTGWPRDPAIRLYNILHVPFTRNLDPNTRGVRRALVSFLMFWTALSLAFSRHYTAIQAANRSLRGAAVLTWLMRIPLIIETRAQSRYPLEVCLRRPLLRRILTRAKLIIHDTPIHKHLPQTTYFPLLPLLTTPTPPYTLPPDDCPLMLTILDAKPLPLLLKAIRLLQLNNPTLQITLLGAVPNLPSRTLDTPGILSPEEQTELLAQSDILLAPPSAIPTPVLLDGMAAGRALVAVQSPAQGELLSADTCLITPPTPQNIAETIDRLVHDAQFRYRLASRPLAALLKTRNPAATLAPLQRAYTYLFPVDSQ